jgi:hypothetical protein
LGSPSTDGGGQRAAVVDVQAAPLALAVGGGEAGQAGVDAADQRAARLDGVQVLAGERGSRRQQAGGKQASGQGTGGE